MLNPRGRLGAWVFLALSALLFIGAAQAAASSPLEDIPEAFADSLGITAETAKVIIASAFIIGVMLAMSRLEASATPSLIVLALLVGLFTTIAYLPGWMLVLTAIVVGLWFATDIKKVFT